MTHGSLTDSGSSLLVQRDGLGKIKLPKRENINQSFSLQVVLDSF